MNNHRAKEWKISEADPVTVAHLEEVLGLDHFFCKLLVQRGIRTFEEAKQFFRPDITELHDPFLMKDMKKAVMRLNQAIEFEEKILIYGDYDVDGTTSVAMMYEFLKPFHSHLEYYIPDRYKEGYGISMAGIDYAKQNGMTLIIAIDCGINAIKQVEKATTFGIDFIICDHHLPKVNIPAATAVLDPKRPDCNYPFKELSGCGVAFKLMQAYLQHHNLPTTPLNKALDLLVISIACDIVPIVGENRILAHFGLKKLNRQPRSGLRTLIRELGREYPFSISDIVFGIGPSINAAGRMADAKLAVQLLLATDKKVGGHLAKELKNKNDKRRVFEVEITKEAKEQVTRPTDWQHQKSIVVYNKDWHKGVIGIVAAKLVDEFHRPAIVLTESNGLAVGSARSIKGFNVHQAIQQSEALLINFGGHQYAAGLTLNITDLEKFKTEFEISVNQIITKKDLTPIQYIDATLNFSDITTKFLRILKQFAPFGPGNRRPVFASYQVKDQGHSKVLKEKHLRLDATQDKKRFKGIGFNLSEHFEIVQNKTFDVCYVIEENTWKGKKRLQLRLKDLKSSEK